MCANSDLDSILNWRATHISMMFFLKQLTSASFSVSYWLFSAQEKFFCFRYVRTTYFPLIFLFYFSFYFDGETVILFPGGQTNYLVEDLMTLLTFLGVTYFTYRFFLGVKALAVICQKLSGECRYKY